MYINGIREAKHKTKVRQNTQDPVWNQPCVFDINRENPKLLGHVFVFHIIHKDMMMGVQKIGQVTGLFHFIINLRKIKFLPCKCFHSFMAMFYTKNTVAFDV